MAYWSVGPRNTRFSGAFRIQCHRDRLGPFISRLRAAPKPGTMAGAASPKRSPGSSLSKPLFSFLTPFDLAYSCTQLFRPHVCCSCKIRNASKCLPSQRRKLLTPCDSQRSVLQYGSRVVTTNELRGFSCYEYSSNHISFSSLLGNGFFLSKTHLSHCRSL